MRSPPAARFLLGIGAVVGLVLLVANLKQSGLGGVGSKGVASVGSADALGSLSNEALEAELARRKGRAEPSGPHHAPAPDRHKHGTGPDSEVPICQQDFGRIGIFIVYTTYAAYGHASNTLRCYAESRGYEMIVVQPFQDPRVQKVCGWLKDIFFIKHCAASIYLKDFDWLYVSDADTAVVNADHCIEEYLDRRADVIMYERFFTSELTSGNYFVQNTAGGRSFLRGWSAMEAEKPAPGIFCSADNGLLHIHMLRVLYPDKPEIHEGCWKALNGSIWPDYEPGYGEFLRCAKTPLLNVHPSPHARVKVQIIPRAQAWVRDTIFTGHDIWPGDFMAHGIKKSEPFDDAMLAKINTFANGTTPTQCYSPAWAPKLNKGKMDTEENMRRRFRILADGFESGRLKPIYADPHFEKCWPRCPMFVQNF